MQMNALMAVLLVAAAPGQSNAITQPVLDLSPPADGVVQTPKPKPRSVYELHLAVDIPVTVIGGGLGLARVLFENRLARKSCPCDPAGINFIDRGTVGNHSAFATTAADVTIYGTLLALPLVDLVDVGFGRVLGEDVMVYVETLAIDTGLQNLTNFIVARPRPRTYAGDPAFVSSGEGYLSFYAGHVSTAFAGVSMAAVTIRKRYGERVWPWVVGGLIASSIAVERVASGHHFPTDVAVAAVVGTGIGITVPWLHFRRGESHVHLTPVGSHGLGLVGAF
jgi:membrane-associated phospholipid phosphatase